MNQQIDLAITRQIESTNIPALLLARGETIVSLDDQGRMIEHRPDGTTTVLEPHPPTAYLLSSPANARRLLTSLEQARHRADDAALLSRADLQESLEQMRRGETEVIVPKPATTGE